MGKRSQYEDKMRIQTLCTIGFRYLLLLQNFLQKKWKLPSLKRQQQQIKSENKTNADDR